MHGHLEAVIDEQYREILTQTEEGDAQILVPARARLMDEFEAVDILTLAE